MSDEELKPGCRATRTSYCDLPIGHDGLHHNKFDEVNWTDKEHLKSGKSEKETENSRIRTDAISLGETKSKVSENIVSSENSSVCQYCEEEMKEGHYCVYG